MDVRAEMVQGIADTQAAEADQLAAYTNFMAVSQQTVDDARQRIVDNRAALAQCVQDIADTEAFREQRQADLAVLRKTLLLNSPDGMPSKLCSIPSSLSSKTKLRLSVRSLTSSLLSLFLTKLSRDSMLDHCDHRLWLIIYK